MTIPSKFRLFIAGTVLAVLMSCSDFAEIPYSERITSSSSGISSSSDISSSSGSSSSSDTSSSSETENTFTDIRDYFTYKYVEIGGNIWMAENLKHAALGVCYEGKPENCNKYGRLYALDSAKKSCPSGWHLPNSEEWDALIATAANDLRNASGFAALFGGSGDNSGFFYGEYGGFWWALEGYYYSVMVNDDDVEFTDFGVDSSDALNSVRCVRNSQ